MEFLPTHEANDKEREGFIPSWSDLTSDVLELITGKLELPDYHRFSAVCQNWHSVAKTKHYSPARSLPWLVLGEEEKTKKRIFFNLSEKRNYYIDIPELYGHICRASSYGWLFTVDEDIKGHLVNPFTRECYDLPPFKGISQTFEGPKNVGMQRKVVDKAILSNDPKENRDFTLAIVYIVGDCNPPPVAFWRPNDPDWTVVKRSPCGRTRDIIFFKDKLYGISANLEVMEVDTGFDPKMTPIHPWVKSSKGLYDACFVDLEGQLLLLQRIQKRYEEDHLMTQKFRICEIDLEEGEAYKWDDIDGAAIFVGSTSTVVVDPSQFPNSIYFTAINGMNYSDEKYGLDDHGMYDIVNKTIGQYYPPDIFIPVITSPVWFTPNPW